MKNMQLIARAALITAVLGSSLASALGAAVPVNPKSTLSASMDGGTAKTGNTWFELGVNPAAPTTGIRTGLIVGQSDPLSTYLIQPATGLNTLMLDSTKTSGTLTLTRPLSFTALSLAGSSGNGRGTNTRHCTSRTAHRTRSPL